MKYNKSFLDTYKKFISKGWYDSVIPTRTLELWCENFSMSPSDKFDSSVCAFFLLNSLVFYQERQLEAIIVQIQDKIKSELNQKYEELRGYRLSDDEIEGIWKIYKQESFIVTAAIPSQTGDSAYQATRFWRNISGIDIGSIADLSKVINESGKKHIFFVDDFIGTGTKMTKFLSSRIPETKETVGDIINRFKDSVDFNIAVFAIYENGKKFILDQFPRVNFYFGDLYTEEYNLISEKCVLYDMFLEEKENIIQYIKDKLKEFNDDNKYALNLPVAFHHGCPNNSLSLYYKSSQNWNKLLSESHPKN